MIPAIELFPSNNPAQSLRPFFAAELPLPPGINHSYHIVYVKNKARLACTDVAEAFKRDAALMLTQSSICNQLVIDAVRRAAKANHERPILAITIRFYFAHPLKRDIDGGEKAVIDVVFSYLRVNDNLIFEKHTTKHVDAEHPRVEIEVRCLLHHPE